MLDDQPSVYDLFEQIDEEVCVHNDGEYYECESSEFRLHVHVTGTVVRIINFAIAKEIRHEGWGTMIMQRIHTWCNKHDFVPIIPEVDTRDNGTAEAFWESLGYEWDPANPDGMHLPGW